MSSQNASGPFRLLKGSKEARAKYQRFELESPAGLHNIIDAEFPCSAS
jgi:hypothetical protein